MSRIVIKARQLRLNYQAKIGRPVFIKEVAEAVGLTEAAVNRIELGQTTRIDFDTLLKLCEFYGVSAGDILEIETDEPQKNEKPGLMSAFAA